VNIELRYLRYFVAVAEELNITRAAERLHTVQPSLGRQIHQLEELVGAPLLQRSGHRLALTKAGRVMLTESRRMLQELDLMFERIRREANAEAGRITVGFFPGGELRVLPRLLPFLRSNYPRIKLVLHSLRGTEQIPSLQNRTIDVGFLRGPVGDDPQLLSEVVLKDKIMAFFPAKHALARQGRISLQKFAQMPMITQTEMETPALNHSLASLEKRAGVKFRSVLETENIFATLSAVGAGMGCSLLPSYVKQLVPSTVVGRRLDINPPPTIDLLLIYRKDDTHKLARFLAAVHNCFQDEQ